MSGDGRLLAALERMKEIGIAVNRLDSDDSLALRDILQRTAEAAAGLIEGALAEIVRGEESVWAGVAQAAQAGGVTLRLPLSVADQRLGELSLTLPVHRTPSPTEQAIFHNLANLAAGALFHASVRRDSQRTLARKEDEISLLRHAGMLISSRTGLQDTLDTILRMALEITGARYGIFRLVNKQRGALVMAAIAGEDLGRPAVEALPINVTSVMGMVAKTQQPVIITDVRELPWSRIYYPLDHGLQMRSELAVPLIGAGGRLEGVLNLESPLVGAFTEADNYLLQGLAGQAVIAIQEVRLLDALRDTSARVLSQDLGQALAHIQALREELVSGDTEWDRKVGSILSQYESLAKENATRQDALREAREAHAVAETFAAMGDIAANLLHHLNNKVGTIPVRVEGIQDKCEQQIAASPYLAANLAEIERAALDAMRTVRERLSLLHPMNPGPASIADCLAEALRAARLPGGVSIEQGAQLASLPTVLSSREGLTLVLLNLLENAGEALSGHGKISISGTTTGESVELTMADNGPGVAPDLQARIFEFDFSGRRRGTQGESGRLGFGLWWVKTLVTRAEGTISVESDGYSGTTFRVRLPCARL